MKSDDWEKRYCCHKCFHLPVEDENYLTYLRQRMILCPTCGNKRCPKATDHDLECTNSNAEGQIGSVYGIPLPKK